MIFGNASNIDELLHRIFVRNIAGRAVISKPLKQIKHLTFRAKQQHQMVYVLAHKGVIGRIPYNREATIKFNKVN